MIVISAKELSKVYGEDVVLEHVSFHVNAGDRVGIVGVNGAGKSTLLRMLTGELAADEGDFFVARDTRIGYLKQRENFREEGTVLAAAMDIFQPMTQLERQMEETAAALEALRRAEGCDAPDSGRAAAQADSAPADTMGTAARHSAPADRPETVKTDSASVDTMGAAAGGASQAAAGGTAAAIHTQLSAVDAPAPIGHLEADDVSHTDSAARDRLIARQAALQEQYFAAGGEAYKSEIRGILHAMGFGEDTWQKPIATLSGGERTRLALAVLLLEKPEILLLDEPTNHLDMDTLRWLEQYLATYRGTILVVSHDRYFLNRVATRIFEVAGHHLTAYDGNYDAYAVKQRQRREAQQRAWENRQDEIRRQEDMIRRFKERGTEKLAKRARSREKRLAAQSAAPQPERPTEDKARMRVTFTQDFPSGTDVLQAENLAITFHPATPSAASTSFAATVAHAPMDTATPGTSASPTSSADTATPRTTSATPGAPGAPAAAAPYAPAPRHPQTAPSTPAKPLFCHVNLDIKRGERVCIVGPNGVGKTTLLHILLGHLTPAEGRVMIGHNVAFAYYDQGQLGLNPANTVLGEMKDAYPLIDDTRMRNILGRFLFHGDDVFATVSSLSGGEKARLSLLKLMLSGANTLILDEPTNHLDIQSREVLEEALLEFPGTLIIVSHDRYFLQRIPTRILELTPTGIREYLGRYDYYLEKRTQFAEQQPPAQSRIPASAQKTTRPGHLPAEQKISPPGRISRPGEKPARPGHISAPADQSSLAGRVPTPEEKPSQAGSLSRHEEGSPQAGRMPGSEAQHRSDRPAAAQTPDAQQIAPATRPSRPDTGAPAPCDAQLPQDAAARRRAVKEREAQERRIRRQAAALEQQIETLEAELHEIEAEMADPEAGADYQRMSRLATRHAETQKALDAAYIEWEALDA